MRFSPSINEVTRVSLRLVWMLAIAVFTPLLSSAKSTRPERMTAAFFVVAHPDDWQLFMGDVAVSRIESGHPVVFIYLTSGGADRPERYWRARESGAYASVLAAENLNRPAALERQDFSCGEVQVLGHAVRRCQFHSSVSYHLRLPDGNTDGGGFSITRHQSLAKLHSAQIGDIESVDGSAKYRDWADIRAAVQRIFTSEAERAGHADFEVHTHDPDPAHNPGDHPDHVAVGQLVGDAVMSLPARLVRYSGYDVVNRPANLNTKAAAAKALLFMSYDRQRLLADETWSAYSELPKAYSAWLFRTYGRN